MALLSFAPPSSPLPPVPLFPSSFLSYSPCYPSPPSSRCVYCCIARQVDCCVVVFRSSPRAPSALLPLFRCVVGRSPAGSLASSSERLIVMCEV